MSKSITVPVDIGRILHDTRGDSNGYVRFRAVGRPHVITGSAFATGVEIVFPTPIVASFDGQAILDPREHLAI